MNTKTTSRLIPVALSVTSLAVTLLLSTSATAAKADTVQNARDATVAFTDPAAALAAGYDLLTDAAGIACIDMPGMGGMGVHYVKGSLVESGKIDPARPQALVYEVHRGRLHLVALEYVVFKSVWDANHNAPPELFGEKFQLTDAGNRFGLPAYYSLHAWIYKHNPSGDFSPWNPAVKCGAAVQADEADVSEQAMDMETNDP